MKTRHDSAYPQCKNTLIALYITDYGNSSMLLFMSTENVYLKATHPCQPEQKPDDDQRKIVHPGCGGTQRSQDATGRRADDDHIPWAPALGSHPTNQGRERVWPEIGADDQGLLLRGPVERAPAHHLGLEEWKFEPWELVCCLSILILTLL